MVDYLAHGAGLSLLAILAVACLRSAPAHWRLRATLVALFLTTAPWTLLPAIPITVADGPTPVLDILPLNVPLATPELTALPASAFASAIASEGWQFPLVPLLLAASALGLVAFVLLALRQRSTLRRWRGLSRDGDHLLGEVPELLRRNCRVRVLPQSSQAAATGLLRPTVWIGEGHLGDERRTSILLHELMHLRRRHPQVALALTFIRCLFWWQPFVWLWVWLARRELEHDCDEACAELLGRDSYRTTLASLIHDAMPQPGLALMGRGSFNLRRVKQLEKPRLLSLRHRVVTTMALCLTPLLILDVSIQAQDDDRPTPAELVAMLDDITGATSAVVTTADGLIGVHFDTDLLDALRVLADNDSRPVFLHPEVATQPRPVRLTVAGTRDEVFRTVSEHVGLASASHPVGVLVAAEPLLATTDWIDGAVVLSAVPSERVRLDIDLKIDDQTIATPVDLLVGTSNWTGFEAEGCRFDIIARRIVEEGVEIELRSHHAIWHKSVPYSRNYLQIWLNVVDGKLPDADGEWHDVELRMAAHKLDHNPGPVPLDRARDDPPAPPPG